MLHTPVPPRPRLLVVDDDSSNRHLVRAALGNGYDVLEVDHGWCISIYMQDPNGIMVEFCHSTREFTAEEVAEAAVLLRATEPPASSPPPSVRGFAGEGQPLHLRGA